MASQSLPNGLDDSHESEMAASSCVLTRFELYGTDYVEDAVHEVSELRCRLFSCLHGGSRYYHCLVSS